MRRHRAELDACPRATWAVGAVALALVVMSGARRSTLLLAVVMVAFAGTKSWAVSEVGGPWPPDDGLAKFRELTGRQLYPVKHPFTKAQYRGECTWFVSQCRSDDPWPTPDGKSGAEYWFGHFQACAIEGKSVYRTNTDPCAPEPGAIACFTKKQPGQDGRVSVLGHVAFVAGVGADGSLDVWDSNYEHDDRIRRWQLKDIREPMTSWKFEGFVYEKSSPTSDPSPPGNGFPAPGREQHRLGDTKIGPDGGTYVWVPPGEFMMGTPEGAKDGYGNERPQHKVGITKGFWLSKHEVTNAQYARFCKATGRTFPKDSNQDDDHPVVWVTWEDAVAYCGHYGLRLPTEAEWEYAARGSNGNRFPWGDGWDPKKCCNGWNRGATDWGRKPGTFPVGSIPTGDSWCCVADMAGNVWEWCADRYKCDYYAESPDSDPTGPGTGDTLVLRGGA